MNAIDQKLHTAIHHGMMRSLLGGLLTLVTNGFLCGGVVQLGHKLKGLSAITYRTIRRYSDMPLMASRWVHYKHYNVQLLRYMTKCSINERIPECMVSLNKNAAGRRKMET